MTFSNMFSSMKMFQFRLSLFLKISLKFVCKGPINNIPALVQIMACYLDGAKPLSKPMMVSLLTNICITQPQWVNTLRLRQSVRHLTDNICKCIFLNEIFEFRLKFHWHLFLIRFPISALVLIIAWHHPGHDNFVGIVCHSMNESYEL